MNEKIERLYALIATSKLRSKVLTVLYKNRFIRQSEIARLLKQKAQNVSIVMYKLEKENLIKCLSEPNKKAWKIYTITELGKEVIEFEKKLKKKIKQRN